MSILVANDLVRTPFEMAREAVLSAQDIRGEGVFHGIETSLLTEIECKLILQLICATISKVEERSWSSSTATNGRYMGAYISRSFTSIKNLHVGLLNCYSV